MTIDRNDPRLTAYALGEMDAKDADVFERELGRDPAARAEVEAIRGLARSMEASLGAEAAPALDGRRREAVQRAAAGPRRVGWPTLVWTAAAAAVLVGVVTAAIVFATKEPERHAADKAIAAEAARTGYLELRETAGARRRGDPYGQEASRDAPPQEPPPARPATPNPSPGLFVGDGISNMSGPSVGGDAVHLDTEAYDRIDGNPFFRTQDRHTSTFSVDVDTASYANVRRFLNEGRLPPKDAVRIEEMINYFRYDDAPPAPGGEHPFAVHAEVATCPWNPRHRLARIAVRGMDIPLRDRPASNLVFLVDVSGSMRDAAKLPLLKRAFALLVDQLDGRDRVSIVVYAGAAGLVLPPTGGDRRGEIRAALDRLEAGGSTNGGEGIRLAYGLARDNFVEGGVNRVILATDGDFNVGTTDRGSLTRLIEEQAESGVFLTILGFGTGNLKDATMEELSNRGNGNYAYVDSLAEGRKVLVEQASGTLLTIAKDVKLQLFFNPETVAGWRLIGYENRLLRARDFNDDTKDAGEIGAGHHVTALYEIVPVGEAVPGPKADPNPFVAKDREATLAAAGAVFRLRLRYKQPDADESTLLERDVHDGRGSFDAAPADLRFAAAVAGCGMLLRDAPHRGSLTWAGVIELAQSSLGADPHGRRAEFVELARRAKALAGDG